MIINLRSEGWWNRARRTGTVTHAALNPATVRNRSMSLELVRIPCPVRQLSRTQRGAAGVRAHPERPVDHRSDGGFRHGQADVQSGVVIRGLTMTATKALHPAQSRLGRLDRASIDPRVSDWQVMPLPIAFHPDAALRQFAVPPGKRLF